MTVPLLINTAVFLIYGWKLMSPSPTFKKSHIDNFLT